MVHDQPVFYFIRFIAFLFLNVCKVVNIQTILIISKQCFNSDYYGLIMLVHHVTITTHAFSQ